MVTVFIPSLEPTSTEPLELKITLQNILSLCSLPVKWLRFVGWAIIHSSSGYLSRDTEGNVPLTDGSVLNDDDTLYYHVPGYHLTDIVDMDLVARHTESQTDPNTRDLSFQNGCLSHDTRCIYTNWHAEACQIIPFACGNGWLRMLVRERSITPPSDDINDIRNGLLLEANVHLLLDHSEVTILVIPNEILDRADIHGFPSSHYTLQHLSIKAPDNTQFLNFNRAPNYHGAKFHDCSPAGLPEPMLLHHAYGASVIINFATDIARKQDSNKRNRPKHHNQTHGPPQIPRTFEDRVLTGQKCRKADPPSESSGARDSGRVTDDWALDYMYDITLNRFAQREHARWEERKHEISDWAKNFAQGSGG